MPYVTALMLDWGNDLMVHLRLRGREPASDAGALAAYLADPPEPLHPDPALLGPFEPEPLEGGQAEPGRWGSSSPWSGAEGKNSRWVATRVPARNGRERIACGNAPATIIAHGWLMERWQLRLYRRWARALARRGIEVWMPRLPHHMERTSEDQWSGERFLSSDLVASIESIRQAVAETRVLVSWLGAQGVPRVGLWGMSLGGWVAALVATLDPGLAGVALWAPLASPSETLWKSRVARDLRRGVMAGGLRPGDENLSLEYLAPARTPLAVPPERLLIIGAIHDRLIYADSLARLGRAWGADVRWTPHGHISLMAAPRPARATVDFLSHALQGS